MRFFDLPKSNARNRKQDEPASAVEVVGPLGEHAGYWRICAVIDARLGQMTLPLPPYVIAQHDQESKKVNISVGDPTIRHQRAMWGVFR